LREVPGVFSQGETLDELEANIREAYSLMLEDQQVPVPGSCVMQRDIVVEL
jgi:predicted RNase H-like HicB family nuclease